MRLRNIAGAKDAIENSIYVIQEPERNFEKWKEVFENENPIEIEIGMGKGKFIIEKARQNPEINFIGIEKFSSVLYRAIQKMDLDPVTNLRFICMDAENITEVFGKEEIDKIYLNFSDPWPKDRHAKRRLPSRQFLKRFATILKSKGTLEFKTDNKNLFEFAEEEIEPAGWKLIAITKDLHKDAILSEGNIMTEYEEKFSRKGNAIYKLIIKHN